MIYASGCYEAHKRNGRSKVKSGRNRRSQTESRYTVGLALGLARQVERFAATTDASMSKAIAPLEFRALILGQ